MSDINELIANAQRPEDTDEVCLRSDLVAEWERLNGQLQQQRAEANEKLAGGKDDDTLAARMRELEEHMREATVQVRLRALDRKAWMNLVQAHPAREGNTADRRLGVNGETFLDAVISACLVEPELDEDKLQAFLDVLTSKQFDNLADKAWGLNRRDVSVPFSLTDSPTAPNSDGTSKPPPD